MFALTKLVSISPYTQEREMHVCMLGGGGGAGVKGLGGGGGGVGEQNDEGRGGRVSCEGRDRN